MSSSKELLSKCLPMDSSPAIKLTGGEQLEGCHGLPVPVGTLPFMAIELLDSASPKFDLCHDLESLFYVVVWHGTGIRNKICTNLHQKKGRNSVRNKISIIVEEWRTGPWTAVKTRKKQFITSAWDILNHINYIPLRLIAYELRDLFNERLQSTLQKSHDKMKIEARAIMMQDPGVAPVPMRKISGPLFAIFPAFAANWGISEVDCQKTCCVVL